MVQLTHVAIALLHILLGIVVLRANRRSAVNVAFVLQSVTFAGWILGIAALQSNAHLRLGVTLAFGFASLIPVTFVFFSVCYPDAKSCFFPWYVRTAFFTGVAFIFLALTTDAIVYKVEIGEAGLSRESGPLYPVFAAYFIGTWCIGLGILAKKWRSSHGVARAQFHYLVVGVIGGFAGGISTNLVLPIITGQPTYAWLGPYFSLVYVGLVAHAIIRHRLLDLRLFIHRGLTIAVAILVSAVPMGLLLLALWPRLVATLDGPELALLLICISAATILVPITRDVASRLLDRYVYRTHANYQRTVREASQVLTRVLHLETLLAFISTTVVRSTATEGVALYLRKDGVFHCAVSETRPDARHFASPREAPLEVVAAVDVAREPILADEVARERETHITSLHERLTENNWSLLLPVLAEDTLIAMIAVGPKLSGDAFYRHDLDLLMTLANQAGIAIKNAQLYAAVTLANEYLENIAATIESGVVAVNPAGRVAMFNRAAERLTGLLAEEITGSLAATLPSCLAEPLLITLSDGQPRTHPEIDLPTVAPVVDGPASRPVICTVSPVRDPAGEVLGAVAVFSDLTPLKELEIERRRAERLAYFQALAAGIAHEIKNPLVAIKTFAQLLPRRRNDARFLEEFGRIATREIDRMQRLVDRLRTLSRPAGGPRHAVDLRTPLAEALELAQPTVEEKNLTLTSRLGGEPCVVLGNHAELEELFLNLVLNAHDATPGGGTIAVEVTRSDTHTTVTVSDTGPGIPPDLQERIFEPFFTTKARGSGLGLAISAGIAQAHGARLRAGNRPVGGAVFTVEFPLASVVPVVLS
jgi:PAS domain S-box-containing protein